MNWNWSKRKTQNYFLFHWTGNRFFFVYFQHKTKQNKTFLLWNENKNRSEIKAEVKLICSWPRTAIQNRKSRKLICSWPGTSVPKKRRLLSPAKSLRFLFFFFERQFPAMNILILLFLFWMAVTGHEHTSFTFPVFNGREHNNFTFSVLNSSSRPWTN